MKLDHSNSCVVLFRKASGYVRPDNQILVTIYSNDLVLALKKLGFKNRKIIIYWLYKYSGSYKKERSNYFLFLVQGISFEEMVDAVEKNYIYLSEITGEIIPMYSTDMFQRLLPRWRVAKI